MSVFDILRDLAWVRRLIHDCPLYTTAAERRGAYRRFLAWQVAGRAHHGALVMDYVNGTRLMVRRHIGGRMHYVLGFGEFDDMAFTAHLLRRDEVFVDVGANIGAYTLIAATCAGAHCVAFEPVERIHHYLSRNVALNQLQSRVELFHSAVGAAAGELSMTAGMGEINHVQRPGEAGDMVRVPVVTLDAFFAQRQPPAMIKMDVEGFETEVINGAAGLLRRQPPLALLLELSGGGERYGYDEMRLHENLLSFGYTPCRYAGMQRKLSPLQAGWRLGDSPNMLYVRDVEEARRRVNEAPPFKLDRYTI